MLSAVVEGWNHCVVSADLVAAAAALVAGRLFVGCLRQVLPVQLLHSLVVSAVSVVAEPAQ